MHWVLGMTDRRPEPGSSLDGSYLLVVSMRREVLSPSSRAPSLKYLRVARRPGTSFLIGDVHLGVDVWTCAPLLGGDTWTAGSGFTVRLARCAGYLCDCRCTSAPLDGCSLLLASRAYARANVGACVRCEMPIACIKTAFNARR